MRMLKYDITPDPESHLLHVELTFRAPGPSVRLEMPVWTPGSYVERPYASCVRRVQAHSANGTLLVHPIEPSVWSIDLASVPEGASVVVRYSVFARSLGIHDAWLDHERGFFNPAALYLLPAHLKDAGSDVRTRICVKAGWMAVTTLEETGDEFEASSLDVLYDAPFTLLPARGSRALRFIVNAAGVDHEIVATGVSSLNVRRLSEDLRRIFETTIAFWDPEGRRAPFEHYLFHLNFASGRYGGLEHADSAVLLDDPAVVPAEGESDPPERYREFLTLCAHEYFHAWLVRRLRPAALVNADLSHPVSLSDLWIYEGFTSYFESALLRKAGLCGREEAARALAERLSAAWSREGFAEMSLARSSRLAWVKLYRQNEDSPYSSTSYYSKGACAALVIDRALQKATKNEWSLERLLSSWYLKERETILARGRTGLEDGGFGALVRELSGVDLEALLAQLVMEEGNRSWWERALDDALEAEGLERRPSPKMKASMRDAGFEAQGLKLTRVMLESPARHCGLETGDELLALEGMRLHAAELERAIERARGRRVEAIWFRGERLMRGELDLRSPKGPWSALLPFTTAPIAQSKREV